MQVVREEPRRQRSPKQRQSDRGTKESLIFFGTSAAVPSPTRGFACIGLMDGGHDSILLDCGDGSVRRILQEGASLKSISTILVTHLHSDHVSGLGQIIETMAIEQRDVDVWLLGPVGLQEYYSSVSRLAKLAARRRFEVRVRELERGNTLTVGNGWIVDTFEMDHTIPCLGYRLKKEGLSIAYTGDTQPCQGSEELSNRVDVLIHEATFLKREREKARETKHSLPQEAAEIARRGEVGKLILTHVNERSETPEEMIDECKNSFPNVSVSKDGLSIPL